MNTKTHPNNVCIIQSCAMLHLLHYNSLFCATPRIQPRVHQAYVLLIQQSHEYRDRVGVHVLIQNRTTGPYAPKFTVVIMTMSCTTTYLDTTM